jgi:purine nucleosidase
MTPALDTGAAAQMNPDIWLDTDPGFDDWMAWALLEAVPALRPVGVSVVAGNAPLHHTLCNALRIQALHGWTTPVHAGCDRPILQSQVTAQDVLGETALPTTGRVLPRTQAAVAQGHAVQALIAAARERPGRLRLLALGPLTNVATAFDTDPALPSLLRDVVIMGGSTDRGNTTAVAEFNIHADPEAAARVFATGVPVVMFGLNVCRQVQIGEEHVRTLRTLGSERAALFADHLDAYVDIARRRGATHMSVYDPTPVAWLAQPELFTLEPAFVDVELDGRLTRGMTVCEFRVPARARANARVALQARGAAVLDWMMATLEKGLK